MQVKIMIIEWLRFQVKPELREAFIEKDHEIWAARADKIYGYLGKEVWIDPETLDVIIVIRWESIETWKSFPKAEIDELDKLMGVLATPFCESHSYQVRKFLN